MSDKTYSELAKERESNSRFNKIISIFKLKSIPANSISMEAQPWLWKNYIPFETSTLIAGKGGIGKSQFLMWLAAQVSNGAKITINGESYDIEKGKVVILSAEDHANYTIIPRLKALGANLDNIEIIESLVNKNDENDEKFLSFETDMGLVEERVKELGSVKLLIIDPVTAYMGNLKSNRENDVRMLVLKINKLAKRNNLAAIINTHNRKSSNSDNPSSAADEVMGSSAWVNTVRMAFSVTRHHDDKKLFLITCCKTNSKEPENLSYRIIPKLLNEKIETSYIEFQNIKSDMTADEAVNQKAYESRREIDRAKEFILRVLSFGSKSREEIYKQAENEEININTLKSARQKLQQDGINIIMEPGQLDKRKFIWYIGN